MWYRSACGICALACLLGGSNVAAQPERADLQFVVSRNSARCILANRRRYAAISRDPVILFLELCPNVEPSDSDIARLNRNSSFVHIRERPDGPAAPRTVLVLSRRQLVCFLAQVRQQARARQVRIDLRRCR